MRIHFPFSTKGSFQVRGYLRVTVMRCYGGCVAAWIPGLLGLEFGGSGIGKKKDL